ncbi:MAG: hypothetical protein U0841_31885 [Chloroflexia bacterium]
MTAPLLVGLVLAALALCYVLAPLVMPRAFGVEASVATHADDAAGDPLIGLRDDLFARIVELDFDHATGKTDEEEYQQERAALKRRALAVLRTLDERDTAGDAIEEAVRVARERRAAMPVEPDAADPALLELDDEVERQVSALRRTRQLPATTRE